MKFIKKALITLSFLFFVAAPMTAVALPETAAAAAHCDRSILGMPTWFRGLTDDQCNIISPDQAPGGLQGFIWAIVLNVVEIGLFIAGLVAFFFILYGGFQYLTGGSNPSQLEAAKKTLLNAVIGLVISMAAIAVVNLIFGVING